MVVTVASRDNLCDSLESILTYFRDNHNTIDDRIGSNIFRKLRTFNYIYVFYFLANILYILSRLFQNKFVNLTTISLVIKTDIV